MKPEQFIREFGVEKAREVVKGAPDWATGINCHSMVYFGGDKFCRGDVLLEDLKCLVESVELVEKFGSLIAAKAYVPDGYKSDRLKQAIKDHETIYGGGVSNQINGFRPDRLSLIKYEVVDLLEENNMPEEVIGQVVRLITEIKTLASNQKADYLSERLSRGKQ